MAPKAQITCEKCGAANFANVGALSTHQKSGKCKFRMQKKPRVVLNPVELQREAETAEIRLMLEEQNGGPSSCSLQAVIDLEHERLEKNPDTQEFDSTVHLLHFIRSCRNQMGLSKSDIDLLLKTLFHPLFVLSKVAFRTALELEQYEAASTEEDDVSAITHYKLLYEFVML